MESQAKFHSMGERASWFQLPPNPFVNGETAMQRVQHGPHQGQTLIETRRSSMFIHSLRNYYYIDVYLFKSVEMQNTDFYYENEDNHRYSKSST